MRAGLVLLALACIWDSDTVDDELRGLPEAASIATGRWFRHGRAYYLRRVERLVPHLGVNPEDLAAYDDLAVAYEKLGRRDEAIAVMSRKAEALRRRPDEEHRYRYHANLGTFLAHKGRYEEAVAELEKAVAINPQAHFGRERLQIDLIRYAAAAKEDPKVWAEANFLAWAGYAIPGRPVLVPYATTRRNGKPLAWQDAYTGVAGMLRFGGMEGPELYRALGDLFVLRGDLHLAWWSYHWAVHRRHPATERVREAIRNIEAHWREAERETWKSVRAPTDELFESVRRNAEEWLAAFHRLEEAAIARGEDPSREEVLRAILAEADRQVPGIPLRSGTAAYPWLVGLGVIGFFCAGLLFLRRWKSS